MALFKIEKGTAANLTTNRPNAVEGYAYFTTDDGRFYIDITGGTTEEPVTAVVGTNRIPLSADRADRIAYAENAQSSIYYNKTITTSDPFILKDGSLIAIKFTDSTPGGTTINDDQENNIVGNVITFNVNNTGAKYVHYRGARIPNEYLVQNKIYLFKATAFTTTQNSQTITDYRYEMIGDVIPVLPGDETVITDEHGNLITRPFVDSYRVVDSLPSEVNVDTNVVYLVPTGESGSGGGGSSSGGGGINLPDQTNNSGKFLTTDGTAVSWAAVDALPSQTNNGGKFLTTNGTNANWTNAPVTSVNTKTGAVSLSASDVGALPDTTDVTKWNGVALTSQIQTDSSVSYVTVKSTAGAGSGNAKWLKAIQNPDAYSIARWDSDAYLYSTTPTANDNSTKVATTAFVKSKVESLGTVLNYKGTKATVAALPTTENTTGDVWIVTADNSEHVWNGTAWEEFGPTIDLSGYVPTGRKINNKALSTDITLTASDVGALNETQVQALIDATITTALSTAYPTA